jgi:hypothetical protein
MIANVHQSVQPTALLRPRIARGLGLDILVFCKNSDGKATRELNGNSMRWLRDPISTHQRSVGSAYNDPHGLTGLVLGTGKMLAESQVSAHRKTRIEDAERQCNGTG